MGNAARKMESQKSLNYGNSNKGKASLRRVEHPKIRREAPNNSSTDCQVA